LPRGAAAPAEGNEAGVRHKTRSFHGNKTAAFSLAKRAENKLRFSLKNYLPAQPFRRLSTHLRKLTSFTILCGCVVAVSFSATQATAPVRIAPAAVPAPIVALAPVASLPEFKFQDLEGNMISVPVVEESAKRKLPKSALAKIDPTLDPKLAHAATIAQERAASQSKSKCWRYVKQALLAAGAVDSYPKTALAKEAAAELVNDYGFKKLPVTDPYAAPIGAVLVYTAKGAPGHVEIRTETGFVSDFKTDKPSKRKLIGVFAKA
jgi:hypothetical protein